MPIPGRDVVEEAIGAPCQPTGKPTPTPHSPQLRFTRIPSHGLTAQGSVSTAREAGFWVLRRARATPDVDHAGEPCPTIPSTTRVCGGRPTRTSPAKEQAHDDNPERSCPASAEAVREYRPSWHSHVHRTVGLGPVGAACGTLLAALAAEVKPEDKVDFLALLTTTGAIAAVICMITAGTLSDRTRSRFGPRNPWIIGGAIVGTPPSSSSRT